MIVGNKLKADLIKINAVVFDFDGIFTNNLVFVFKDGSEAVVCNRSDGLGLSRLRRLGVDMLILSTETNPVVSKRAEKLKLPVIQSVQDKLSELLDYSKKKQWNLENVAYLGNDINDRDCLEAVGMPVVVSDAMPEIKPFARVILQNAGGKGAVREFCDMLYHAKQKGKIS